MVSKTVTHEVTIKEATVHGSDYVWYYEVRCNICGILGTYKERTKADNRKSTHDRGQDAGAD